MSRKDYGPDSESGEGVEPSRERSLPSRESIESGLSREGRRVKRPLEAPLLIRGTLAGLGTYLFVYALAWHQYRLVSRTAEGVDPWTYASWIFFNAQGVALRQGEGTVNVLDPSRADVGSALLPFVGIGLLTAAGYALVARAEPDGVVDTLRGVLYLVPGCLALSVAFALLSVHSFEAADLSVPMSDAVLFVGVGYPLLFGTAGAAVYWWRTADLDALVGSGE